MKQAFKLADAAQACLRGNYSTPKIPPFSYTLTKSSFNRFYRDSSGRDNTESNPPKKLPCSVYELFLEKFANPEPLPRYDLIERATQLRDELLPYVDRFDEASRVLDEKADFLIKSSGDGRGFLQLLKLLSTWPHFALEVFKWRRRNSENGFPMTSEEYSKGIALAGRTKDVDFAIQLFDEAGGKKLRTTGIYNALMSAYMHNGIVDKCELVFRELKRDRYCSPSIETYNILMSLFGRLMLVNHMEAIFEEVQNSNLSPGVSTYNYLIAGYLTAWMWSRMEETLNMMKVRLVKPDATTHMLMLRGYAHSGKLIKMEETRELIKDYLVDEKGASSILAMICAYCKSSGKGRVEKVEELTKFIPEDKYLPWLNVMLIRLYAQEDCIERMESYIELAFDRQTVVLSTGVMRCIITAYYRCNEVDKLANFVKRAETAGWNICRSLYHCQMVMYGSQNRLGEMEKVLSDMDSVRLDWTKKTLWILYKVYFNCGKKSKLDQVAGLMCKYGYGIPFDLYSS